MFALSTAWNAKRCGCGTAIVGEIAALGFENLELNFSLDADQVKDVAAAARDQHLRITSLHNFCPYPEEFSRQAALPDAFSLSSLDESERKKAVEYTKRTIATASGLNAQAVVLHCGRVEMQDQTRALIALVANGQRDTPTYKMLFEQTKEERAAKAPDFLHQIIKSLEELSSYAQDRRVLLGLENRFYHREIPSFEEFGSLFERFKNDGSIAYWHDVGHAFILETLGFMNKGALLETYSEKLCGFHLHNIKNLEDHHAPLEGDFDFTSLKAYCDRTTLNVIEAHAQAPAKSVARSLEYLKGVLGD
ncbi:MAG: TIM barrel protein [Candidatus Omnitrophota bacterium]